MVSAPSEMILDTVLDDRPDVFGGVEVGRRTRPLAAGEEVHSRLTKECLGCKRLAAWRLIMEKRHVGDTDDVLGVLEERNDMIREDGTEVLPVPLRTVLLEHPEDRFRSEDHEDPDARRGLRETSEAFVVINVFRRLCPDPVVLVIWATE